MDDPSRQSICSGPSDLKSEKGITRLLHNPVTAWVVLLCSLLLTGLGWYVSNRFVTHRASDRFYFRTEDVQSAVRQRLLEYEQVLRGGVGLFRASQSVGRQRWREYVRTLRIDEYYPGIQGIGFSLRIPREKKEAHIRTVRSEGFPHYTIRPDTVRAEYHSIVYLEPFDWRNQRAFGYDMFTEPVRRAAMERSRDTGFPSLSGKVTLVQETETDVQPGFLMYLPVYRHGQPR